MSLPLAPRTLTRYRLCDFLHRIASRSRTYSAKSLYETLQNSMSYYLIQIYIPYKSELLPTDIYIGDIGRSTHLVRLSGRNQFHFPINTCCGFHLNILHIMVLFSTRFPLIKYQIPMELRKDLHTIEILV
jgi:hypothetical protein